MASVVLRVSIMRCDPADFERLRTMTTDAETALRPDIEAIPGLLAYYARTDEVSHSLTNTSASATLEHAKQMDRFAPMLELGKGFAGAGARFHQPIMAAPRSMPPNAHTAPCSLPLHQLRSPQYPAGFKFSFWGGELYQHTGALSRSSIVGDRRKPYVGAGERQERADRPRILSWQAHAQVLDAWIRAQPPMAHLSC